jgi:hypothetical protein
MKIQSSFKLFTVHMLRILLFPFIAVCVLFAILPMIQDVPPAILRESITFIILIMVGGIPFLYLFLIPKSITVSNDKIGLSYMRRSCSIEKNEIKESYLIQSGRRPGIMKISIGDHNSHLINLAAFSSSDRETLCKAIIGDHPKPPKGATKKIDLDYADWLPERLLGSKFNAKLWNWGTAFALLAPLQIRPSSKRDGYIKYQRINTAFLLLLSLVMSGVLFLGSSIVSLASLASEEPITGSKILIILVINCLIAYASLSMIFGTYGRMKLLKRIKEDRTSQVS